MPYIPQTLACSVPNSADPVTAQAIAAAQANNAAMDAQANKALAAWMALLDRTPADFADLYMPPAQFVQPQSAAQLLNLPGANSSASSAGGGSSSGVLPGGLATAKSVAAFRASKWCKLDPARAPAVQPIQGGFVTPPVMVPLTTPPLGPLPAPPAPPARVGAPPPPPSNQGACRTPNICADLRSGCVQARQVDPQQLLLCAMRGWTGNQNLYPAIAADPNLPYLGLVDPNPPAYAPGMGCAGADCTCSREKSCGCGMGDVSAPDLGSLVVGGLAVFAVTYFTLQQFYGGGGNRKKRR